MTLFTKYSDKDQSFFVKKSCQIKEKTQIVCRYYRSLISVNQKGYAAATHCLRLNYFEENWMKFKN